MSTKYLDSTGLVHFWGKLKERFQDKLVSGTNIKTINGQSLLGSGDLPVAPPVTSTDVPTADTIAEFDSDAHMNSTDMSDSEVSDFVDGLNVSGGALLKTSKITVSINKTSGSSVSITAPSVSGYSFVCWIGCATSGWVGSTYIQNMSAISTNIGNPTQGQSGTGNVEAWALYSKT